MNFIHAFLLIYFSFNTFGLLIEIKNGMLKGESRKNKILFSILCLLFFTPVVTFEIFKKDE